MVIESWERLSINSSFGRIHFRCSSNHGRASWGQCTATTSGSKLLTSRNSQATTQQEMVRLTSRFPLFALVCRFRLISRLEFWNFLFLLSESRCRCCRHRRCRLMPEDNPPPHPPWMVKRPDLQEHIPLTRDALSPQTTEYGTSLLKRAVSTLISALVWPRASACWPTYFSHAVFIVIVFVIVDSTSSPRHPEPKVALCMPWSTDTPASASACIAARPQRWHSALVVAYTTLHKFTGAKRDADGYLWITGRIDDMLNVSGHLLSTAEVESALIEHPSVAETAVVAHPHQIKGECLYCFITLKDVSSCCIQLLWLSKEVARPEKKRKINHPGVVRLTLAILSLLKSPLEKGWPIFKPQTGAFGK